VQELVPYMDTNFRTLTTRDFRGIAGHFMGGYGAIRFGMKYPELFGSVYALHPVGTGNGVKDRRQSNGPHAQPLLSGIAGWSICRQPEVATRIEIRLGAQRLKLGPRLL